MFYKTDTHEYQEWLLSRYRPLMGAEDKPDPADDGDPADPNPADPANQDPPGGSGDEENEDDDGPGGGGDADLDELDRVRRERDDIRSELARAQAAAQKAKQEARKAREDAAKKGGNWEAVAKERESELAEANERATSFEQRAIRAEEDLDNFRREVRVSRIAMKLGFKDPEDAMDKLRRQPEATGDDKSCERALRKLASDKPYLVDVRRVHGRQMNGENGDGGLLTKEQIAAMTPDQIQAARASGQLQRSLAAMPRPGAGPVPAG